MDGLRSVGADLLEGTQGKTLHQLFDQVITTWGVSPGIAAALGVPESTIRSLRKQHKDGRHVTDEKKREILTAAGYKCVQVELWE